MTKLNDTQHFKAKEIIYSKTAEKNNIDNYPKDEEVICNLNYTLQRLNEIREGFGSPIYINSGYRCEELNTRVDGAKTSAHKSGYAMDIVPANNKKVEFFEFMQEYLQDKEFDELLLEKSAKSMWIHFALKSSQGKQRRKIRTLQVQ